MRRDRSHYKSAAQFVGGFLFVVAVGALCAVIVWGVIHHAP